MAQLCCYDEFLIATECSINRERKKGQYVVLRAMAFLMLHRGEFIAIPALEYRGDIDDFLARSMAYVNDNAPENVIVDYENPFVRCMQISAHLFGENGFRFSGNGIRRPINMPLFEALSYLFSFVPEKIDYTWAARLILDIESVKEEFDDSRYFSGNIDSTTSVSFRFDRMDKIINRIQL